MGCFCHFTLNALHRDVHLPPHSYRLRKENTERERVIPKERKTFIFHSNQPKSFPIETIFKCEIQQNASFFSPKKLTPIWPVHTCIHWTRYRHLNSSRKWSHPRNKLQLWKSTWPHAMSNYALTLLQDETALKQKPLHLTFLPHKTISVWFSPLSALNDIFSNVKYLFSQHYNQIQHGTISITIL